MIKKIRTKIRNLFFAGLLVIVPVALTVFIFKFLLNKFDKIVYPAGAKLLISLGLDIPRGYHIPGLGFIVIFILIICIGLLTTGILGKKLLRIWENAVSQIPLARNIYIGAKQIVEAFTINRSVFTEVVLIEYPRRGLHSIGFVTCESSSEIKNAINNSKSSDEVVNVFVPTTPNPTSGVLVFIPRKDVRHLSITVEEGIKLVISGGIVSPPETGDDALQNKK